MTDTKRSRAQVLRQRITEALNEAAALLAAGDRGANTRTCAERARALATELKALSLRMGSADGYDDAVQIVAVIEQLQAKLKPSTDKNE